VGCATVPIKKFHARVFNKSNDELILEFLRSTNKAVPPIAIALGTGLSSCKISQRLKKLLKYKVLRRFYRKLPLYTLRADYNGE
jgi:DNA-binding Lrp family transcriptional regulator